MLKDYIAISKTRIAVMVMATCALGYALAGGAVDLKLFWTVLGTGAASCCCGALNQALEREEDSRMTRTRARPVAAGRLSPWQAALFGAAMGVVGLAILAWASGPLPCLLTAATILLYAGAYTPLKKVTPQTTWLGAAAGATPPLIGWAAFSGRLPIQAWILFSIQFLWQIPHFLAMFWLHREDYARAGFRVMPVVDENGGLTAIQIAVHSLTILGASLLPVFCGMAGLGYACGALALGTAYLGLGLKASWTLEAIDTRRLFLASLAYLPLLFSMLLIGA